MNVTTLTVFCGLVFVLACPLSPAGEAQALGQVQLSAPVATTNVTPKQGAKPLDSHIVLTNTAAAPASAKGTAELQPGLVSLNTQGLSPGRYDLVAVKKSDGSALPLGVLTISDPTLSPDREANDSKKEANDSEQSPTLTTQTRLALPAGLDATDIGQLRVSFHGNDMLVGNPPP